MNEPKSGPSSVAVLGAGTLGRSLARGWVEAGLLTPEQIHVTRRDPDDLGDMATEGFAVGTDNPAAVAAANTVLVSVRPAQVAAVLAEIRPVLDPDRHTVVSVAAGLTLARLRALVGPGVEIVRAMPNTAVATRNSMTCVATDSQGGRGLERALPLFDAVGHTRVIHEELMLAATALCGCGVAFFLRAIRAAAQGGTQIGLRAEDALELAAQTALGAARLALQNGTHPESEIDQVTTPEGCTIAGLNELEHQGFSSAMIRGMLVSSQRAQQMAEEADGSSSPSMPLA
jgi:pyrroline-5-carboxylate reductase